MPHVASEDILTCPTAPPRRQGTALNPDCSVVCASDQAISHRGTDRRSARPERRRHPRIRTELRGRLEFPEGAVPFLLTNVSMGGALVVPRHPLPPGMLPLGGWLTITVTPPGGEEPLSLRARVARHTQQDGGIAYGVEFVELDGDRANRLEELLMQAMHAG